ncbi:HNH endonuclease [Nonomuraea sp. NPDC004580]|uniref:HNH endonuclease n=1 Tax=Nonomuraea sp. NPDC004580 TaxID=3154552 RepID=UPI0033BDCFF6
MSTITVTTREAAAALHVSVRTVQRRCAAGQLDASGRRRDVGDVIYPAWPRASRPKNLRGMRARKVRRKLAKRDGGSRCFYCAKPFADLHLDATFDHFIPYRVWRTWRQENLVLACDPCNQAKGSRLPWPFVWLLLQYADAIRALTPRPAAAALPLAA